MCSCACLCHVFGISFYITFILFLWRFLCYVCNLYLFHAFSGLDSVGYNIHLWILNTCFAIFWRNKIENINKMSCIKVSWFTSSKIHCKAFALTHKILRHFFFLSAKQEVFRKSLKWYKDIAVSCLKDNNKPVHILQYEKLKTNLSSELHSLATFLNVPVTPDDVKCAVDNCRGQYHRQASFEHRIKQINEVFTSEDFLEIDQLQRDVETLLHERFKRTFDLTSELIKLRRNIYNSVWGYCTALTPKCMQWTD